MMLAHQWGNYVISLTLGSLTSVVWFKVNELSLFIGLLVASSIVVVSTQQLRSSNIYRYYNLSNNLVGY